jgi:hypothetical protein
MPDCLLELTSMASGQGRNGVAIQFSKSEACRIAGLPPATLAAWALLAAPFGFELHASFGIGGLVAFSVLRKLAERRSIYAAGITQVFEVLMPCRDEGWLAARTAIVGPDFARLCELRTVHVRCNGDQFVVLPLRLIVSDLRDKVFS